MQYQEEKQTFTICSISSVTNITGTAKRANVVEASCIIMTIICSLETFIDIDAFRSIYESIARQTCTEEATSCVCAVMVTSLRTVLQALIDIYKEEFDNSLPAKRSNIPLNISPWFHPPSCLVKFWITSPTCWVA